jgi:hypothetical protein
MQSFSGGYDADVMALFDPVVSVKAKTSHGSTGTAKVEAVVKSANS